ncbi:response regulator transcription factor [Clostridium sp. 'deep sea']|uniref:response regulator transcription factor n=1 Tax=Clostridium sp. 'deep sea' TaxID=2779445 RepID=UPI0018968F86|nr:response regulator transcription factor [Clostridium sp. 'deep sea']QOR34264.1 response regulator transcription factor [Clostridium sp. 'deep sea']
MNRILIIEDDIKIARFIELELKHEGYVTKSVHDGRQGLNEALDNEHDLIILDLMLPGLNGLEICRRVRQHKQVPIIMLTARDDTMDKVMGLDLGADDYITKPFAIEELLARIRVLNRRMSSQNASNKSSLIVCGKLKINTAEHTVTFNNEVIELTRTEFDLLYYLASNKNIALTRDQILDAVWGEDYFGGHKIVDVYIRYLRSKIDDVYNTNCIHTVRGVGYSFRNEKAKSQN